MGMLRFHQGNGRVRSRRARWRDGAIVIVMGVAMVCEVTHQRQTAAIEQHRADCDNRQP